MEFKSSAQLEFSYKNPKELYELLSTEDYDFKNKEIKLSIDESKTGVIIKIEASTPQLLKIATTAVINSCDVIFKTKQIVNEK